ncbi:MAG: hypothetical protein CMK74_01990 [Pseudomonadales bacterium]|nr:hypothetical protein [Pseudomonadales bacterium]|tara:strand:+ start:1491 stop:2444 length:954 start_codon:yes stop_codon:yes gene_type:complete
MTEQVEELTKGDALAKVAALEAEVAELRKRACVPEGWMVVPSQCTSQMEDAYDQQCADDNAYGCSMHLPAYEAMLAAAPAPVERLATDGGRNQRFEGLFEGETPDQRDARLASAAPVEREAAVLAVQPAMNWRNCYHRASMDLCAIGELLGVPEEDQCTPEIIEAIKALQQSNPPEQVEPVAWMHDSPGRVDVISAEVKKLLVDSHDTAGHLHRPLDKSEHYTIPLYTAPAMKEHEEMKNAMQLAQGPKPTTLGQLHDYLDSIRKAWSAQDTKYLGSYESQPLYILPNEPTPGFQLAEAKYFAEFGLTFIPVEGASK